MLKRIGIKNIGRFTNSNGKGNTELTKYSFVFGANGHGKTTICAVLRSAQTGNADPLIGRKTLGATAASSVDLLFDGSGVRFDGAAWDKTAPDLAVFDSAYVSENIHSGEVVDTDHKRNLYRVIIGAEGVHLAERDSQLAADSRAKTREISAVAKLIQPHVPPGMTLEQFLKVPANPGIDVRIADQTRNLEAIRQAAQIQNRPLPSEITLPIIPAFASLLEKTIDEIAEGAERQLSDHIAAHGMAANGESWVAAGMPHIEHGVCPFCGQNINGLPLITAYRSVFSDAYKGLVADIKTYLGIIQEEFGEGKIGWLAAQIEKNKAAADFWHQYCPIDPTMLAMPENLLDTIRDLGVAALELLDRKARSPLEAVPLSKEYQEAVAAFQALKEAVNAANMAIFAAKDVFNAKKAETGVADVRVAENELQRLQAFKKRHEQPLVQHCDDHIRLSTEKDVIDNEKAEVRKKLDEYTNSAVKPYEKRINELLDAFAADFTIAETKHSYVGGVATSSYQIVINATAVDLGDGNTPATKPSFKNTLSSGDRSTLALAFFLAHLERDKGHGNKIVVLDDPFNSQDAFRRVQTIQEIRRMGKKCAQVIVLSHDAGFLKDVWAKVQPAERTALMIDNARTQGCKLVPWAIESACAGRIIAEITDLQAYLTNNEGKPLDIAKKMRPVLEDHCRRVYYGYFGDQDTLGEIMRKTRDGGDQHPAHHIYEELDVINEFTAPFHHADLAAVPTADQIDKTQLDSFVRRTLRVAKALPN
ncbi:AAA family ATPase [Novispirillum itersonii]|uniref:Wobble nucleotide-excising tRNase n=1 Tax=Novispirillum itersonii TaxID=189 RepID=A0A7W9ZJ71_NOVIT|nr:AAA family ATPase [Novispirillum itersonii]MBB6212485.1 wobble nucleotide-excising tRNase [Novispirillum itersonii]